MQILLDDGADKSVQDARGRTPKDVSASDELADILG